MLTWHIRWSSAPRDKRQRHGGRSDPAHLIASSTGSTRAPAYARVHRPQPRSTEWHDAGAPGRSLSCVGPEPEPPPERLDLVVDRAPERGVERLVLVDRVYDEHPRGPVCGGV